MAIGIAHVWTPEQDRAIGNVSDAKLGATIGASESVVRTRRLKLGIPPWRKANGPITIECATCGKPKVRQAKNSKRSKKLYCSKICADGGQKKRDTEALRYGKGWKKIKKEVLERDKVCVVCRAAPKVGEPALHVHHLKPYRFGGTNNPKNLVTLCDSCHHRIEAATTATLDSIQIDVSLIDSCLTICLDGRELSRGFVRGADSQRSTKK